MAHIMMSPKQHGMLQNCNAQLLCDHVEFETTNFDYYIHINAKAILLKTYCPISSQTKSVFIRSSTLTESISQKTY